MDHTQFLQHLDELLEKQPGTLRGPDKLEDVEGWDSVALISFLAMVDERYGKRLSPREVGRCETVDDLFTLVNNAS